MKKTRRAWGASAQDASAYGYLSARWRPEQGWHDVASVGAVPEGVVTTLDQHTPAVELMCRLFGAAGVVVTLAPNRPPPAYWLDRNAGIAAPSSMVHGTTADTMDVIVCEVLGVPSRDWTAAMESRARGVLLDLHAAVATTAEPLPAPLVPHG